MNNLNSIILEGILSEDPKKDEKENIKFTLMTNRFYRNNDMLENEKSFFDIIIEKGPVAESCFKNLGKGGAIRIFGRLKEHKYQDEKGIHLSKVVVVANYAEIRYKLKDADEVR